MGEVLKLNTDGQDIDSERENLEQFGEKAVEENRLKEAVFDTMDGFLGSIQVGLDNLYESIGSDKRFKDDALLDSLENVSKHETNTSKLENESLINLIDALYPSQYGNEIVGKPAEKEEAYLEDASRRDTIMREMISSLAMATEENPSLKSLEVSNDINNLGNKFNQDRHVPQAMVDYLLEPNGKNRDNLYLAFDSDTNHTHDTLGSIEEQLYGKAREIGKDVFNLNKVYKSRIEDYYSSLMEYIDFKIVNKPADRVEEASEQE